MNWLADNPLAVAGCWAAAAALAFWLYLHSREPLRRRVATLRFWNSVQSSSQPRRRRIREPWALAAQLLFLLLLVVALANPRWGITATGRSVVIVLDNSIWSQVTANGRSSLIDDIHREAEKLLKGLPQGDQVLLISADPNAPPVLPFTTDKAAVERAIFATRSTSGVSDIPRALQLGESALTGGDRTLLVYVGPGMLDARQAQSFEQVREQIERAESGGKKSQFLVRQVGSNIQNRGITRIDVRRDAEQPDRWHLLTQVKNYGDNQTQLTLKLSLAGQSFVQRSITLGAGELADVENDFQWDQGGLLQAEISPPDALAVDDRAAVVLPAFHPVRVSLSAADPAFAEKALNVLASNPYLQIDALGSGEGIGEKPDVAIYQGMNLPAQPGVNSIYFLGGSPVASNSPLLRVTSWNSQHPAVQWVRSRDVTVRGATTLNLRPGDTVLAMGGSPARPLVIAREQDGHRLVIVGFDPIDSNFELQPAFPLLMAGSIEWMTYPFDETVHSYTAGEVDLPGRASRIIAPSGAEVSFAPNGTDLRLLANELGVYRVLEGNGERDFAVNAPLLPTQRLAPNALEGMAPESEALLEVAQTMWRWLVVLALFATCLEWWFYYHSTRKRQLAEERRSYDPTDFRNSLPTGLDNGREENRDTATFVHKASV